MTSTPQEPGFAVTRRQVIVGGAAGVALAGFSLGTRGVPAHAGTPDEAVPLLDPLPPGAPDRHQFALIEQRLAPYLVTLAPMVNEIVTPPSATAGWMAGGWWRTPAEPFNARIQEHIYTLSWFYTNSRPWNPYAGDPALLARLDLAIHYYLGLQHADGSWPEYEPSERSRAATSFALGYLSKTLENLRRSDVLVPTQDAIVASLKRAMEWFLDPDNEGVWQSERIEFVNQPMAGLAGAALSLHLDPDPQLWQQFTARLDEIIAKGQSPAGFFYEPRGMDIAYNVNVTLSEMIEILDVVDKPELIAMVERLADWLGYNMVWEPDGAGFITNVAGSARTPVYFVDDVATEPQQKDLGSRFCPLVPAMSAFYTSARDRVAGRLAWAASDEPVPVQERGATNPRIVVNIPYGEAFPSKREHREEISRLPYLASDRFTELRRDPQQQDYLFVRRPGLYTMAHYGVAATTLVRSGLSLIWHPDAGAFVHGYHNSNTQCWGTVLPNGGTDAGATTLMARYFEGDPQDGAELADAAAVAAAHDLGISWLTTQGNIRGEATVTDRAITKRVEVTSDAVEQIPLVLRPTDRLTWSRGGSTSPGVPQERSARALIVQRGRVKLFIEWGEDLPVTLEPLDRRYFVDASRQAHMLRISHSPTAEFSYSLRG